MLDYDKATGTVTYRKSGNVAVDTSKSDDELAAAGDDTVRNVKSIVDAAVAKGQEEGDQASRLHRRRHHHRLQGRRARRPCLRIHDG